MSARHPLAKKLRLALRPTEKQVQLGVKRLLGSFAIKYYDTSQPFRAAITKGVPDLICICQKRGLFFVECKREGGIQTPEQKDFQERCEKAGVPYILGGTEEVARFLAVTR